MKKYFFTVTAMALTIGIFGMIQQAETVQTSASDVNPAYTVMIPEKIVLGETVDITAQDLSLPEGETICVRLSGTGEADNAFRLHSDTHELTYSVMQNGEKISVGTQILNAESKNESASLEFSLPEGRPYPGDYQGTVQFSVSTVNSGGRTISVPGIGYLNTSAGKENLEINLYNPESNPCYFGYELILKETGETLWKSEELLAPGTGLAVIPLTRPLEAGEYQAILKVSAFDSETMAELNGSEIRFELRVKED